VFGGVIADKPRVFSSDLRRIQVAGTGKEVILYRGTNGSLCFTPGKDTSADTVTELPVVITVVDDKGSSATMTVTIRNETTTTTITSGDPPVTTVTTTSC